MLESDTALLIVGSSQLMRAHLNQTRSNARLERLVAGRSWGVLYPSSAVRDPSGVGPSVKLSNGIRLLTRPDDTARTSAAVPRVLTDEPAS